MKKSIKYSLITSLIIVLCLPTFYFSKKNTELLQTNNSLENENKNLEHINKELSSNLRNLETELYQLKDEPANLIIQIRNAYENKNYENVKILSDKLHNSSNGTDFDIEAQNYIKSIEEIESKSAIQKAKEIMEITNIAVKPNYIYNFFQNMTVTFSYKINTTKKIRYINVAVSVLNAKNEVINFRTDSSKTSENLLFFAPTQNINSTNVLEENWNNLAIKKIIITSITINYHDNSEDVLTCTKDFNFVLTQHKEPVNNSNDSKTEKTEKIVYITPTGTKYHKNSCSYLNENKIPIDLSEATKQGYTSCSRCNP